MATGAVQANAAACTAKSIVRGSAARATPGTKSDFVPPQPPRQAYSVVLGWRTNVLRLNKVAHVPAKPGQRQPSDLCRDGQAGQFVPETSASRAGRRRLTQA